MEIMDGYSLLIQEVINKLRFSILNILLEYPLSGPTKPGVVDFSGLYILIKIHCGWDKFGVDWVKWKMLNEHGGGFLWNS